MCGGEGPVTCVMCECLRMYMYMYITSMSAEAPPTFGHLGQSWSPPYLSKSAQLRFACEADMHV